MPILRCTDHGTSWNTSIYIPNKEAATCFEYFMISWVFPCLRSSHHFYNDRGAEFIGSAFQNQCKKISIKTVPIGAESHNSMAYVERYNDVIERAFNKLTLEMHRVSGTFKLASATKAANECLALKEEFLFLNCLGASLGCHCNLTKNFVSLKT